MNNKHPGEPPPEPTPEPTPNRAPKPPRLPAEDQEVAGLDAEGKPVFRRKRSAIEGPRAGTSSAAWRSGARRGGPR